jgi:glycosyltransferase involved in cell wall biosynthesis
MRVLVALEQRFTKDAAGGVYANGIFNYPFFARYLEIFDEVAVFARVCQGEGVWPPSYRADGPRVSFIEVPCFVGPVEYLKMRPAVHAAAANAVSQADAFVFRVPGMMGALLGKELRKRRIPYGVEVVGDPWDSMGMCGGHSVLKPFLRAYAYWTMKRQCSRAAVAAYVTERTLQKRYPPGGWSTSYSSIELAGDHLLDAEQLKNRLEFMKEPFKKKRLFRICHVGSMDALYKAQDTLIEAVSISRQHGFLLDVVLVGGGRYQGVFEQKAQKLNISEQVRFFENLSPKDVREKLDRSDVFVLPSLTEGLPRALIEAMARGLPCLASQVGGNAELLASEYLFPVRNSEFLAQKLLWLLGDYERLGNAARANLRKASDYKSDVLALKRRECYQYLKKVTAESVVHV